MKAAVIESHGGPEVVERVLGHRLHRQGAHGDVVVGHGLPGRERPHGHDDVDGGRRRWPQRVHGCRDRQAAAGGGQHEPGPPQPRQRPPARAAARRRRGEVGGGRAAGSEAQRAHARDARAPPRAPGTVLGRAVDDAWAGRAGGGLSAVPCRRTGRCAAPQSRRPAVPEDALRPQARCVRTRSWRSTSRTTTSSTTSSTTRRSWTTRSTTRGSRCGRSRSP